MIWTDAQNLSFDESDDKVACIEQCKFGLGICVCMNMCVVCFITLHVKITLQTLGGIISM